MPTSHVPSGSELLSAMRVLERVSVREGMRVADLGCGTIGHFVFPAARLVGKSGVVYAVDILKSALAGVESRAKLEGVTNVQTLWSDIEIVGAAKIPPASLDIVMLVNNQPKSSMMTEALRLLRAGGKLLVVDWKTSAAPFGPPSKDRISPAAVKVMAEEHHLRFVEEFEAGKYHYGVVFVK